MGTVSVVIMLVRRAERSEVAALTVVCCGDDMLADVRPEIRGIFVGVSLIVADELPRVCVDEDMEEGCVDATDE